MQLLKTLKLFELFWPFRKQPLVHLQRNLRVFRFQKMLWFDSLLPSVLVWVSALQIPCVVNSHLPVTSLLQSSQWYGNQPNSQHHLSERNSHHYWEYPQLIKGVNSSPINTVTLNAMYSLFISRWIFLAKMLPF